MTIKMVGKYWRHAMALCSGTILVLGELAVLPVAAGPSGRPGSLPEEPLGPCSRRTGVVISEIMYHPAADLGRAFEFIEIYNSDPVEVNLEGYRLDGDVQFTFPPETVLPSRAFLVVAGQPAQIQQAYGVTNVLGGWSGSLPGDSGTIELYHRNGGLLLEIEYSDDTPWPIAADGGGHSLVLGRPSYGERDGRAWTQSRWMGGSPGGPEPEIEMAGATILINEIVVLPETPGSGFVELYNHHREPVDISNWRLQSPADGSEVTVQPGTVIEGAGYAVLPLPGGAQGLDPSRGRIFLVNSEGTRVVEALQYPGQAPASSFGRFPDGASEFHPLVQPTPGGANADLRIPDIVISEIMYHPISNEEEDEYLELTNRGQEPLDLSGWRFTDGIEFTFPQSTVVPPGRSIVVARDRDRLIARYGQLNARNTTGNFAGSLSNRGERLALSRPQQHPTALGEWHWVVVDELTYGEGGRWGEWSDGGGSSLELIDLESDNRQAANWRDSDETGKSDWVTIEHTGILDLGRGTADELHAMILRGGECLLDDIEVFPEDGTNLISNGTFEGGLEGWIRGGNHVRSGLEESEGYESAQSLRLRATAGGDNGANRVEINLIRQPRLRSGDLATIRARARWLRGHSDVLLRLRGNYLEAVGQLDVPTNLGTPGLPNSMAVSNAGPAIFRVQHHPPVPKPDEPVRVTVRCLDSDGISAVRLRYRIDPVEEDSEVEMTDDGMGGDEVENDGVYSALIPGQPDRNLVAFRIEASDGADLSSVSSFPRETGDECLVQFGAARPEGSFPVYEMWITRRNVQVWAQREVMSNEPLDVTFIYGNRRVIYNAGARYRGSPFIRPRFSSPTGSLCAYLVTLPDDDRLFGEDELNLDWLEQPDRDSTYQREKMAFWIAEEMGLPVSHLRYIRLFVNGRPRGRVYTDSQQPNGDYVETWFAGSEQGELFKIDDWFEFTDSVSMEFNVDATLQDFTTTDGTKKKARYRWNWEKKVNHGLDDDYSSLFDLVDALNSPSPTYRQNVEAVIDVDQWMRVFALRHLVGDWDGYGYQRGKNMFTYKPSDGRWHMLLWDMDFALGANSHPVDASPFFVTDPTISRMYNHPPFMRSYLRAMAEALDGPFRTERLEPVMTANYEALSANEVRATGPGGIQRWMESRSNFIAGVLADFETEFALNDGDRTITTVQNWVNLSGTAPIAVAAIRVNGVERPVTWDSVFHWRLPMVVTEPESVFIIEGVDSKGRPVPESSARKTIRYRGPPVPSPQEHLAVSEILYAAHRPRSEFIEVANYSTLYAFDISGSYFSGVDFQFPPGSILLPGEHRVIARDRFAFGRTFGMDLPIAGEFGGRLENDGETLRWVHPRGAGSTPVLLDEIAFDNSAPWPAQASEGASLQLIDPTADHLWPANWGAEKSIDPDQPTWQFVQVSGVATSNRLLIYHSPFAEPRDSRDITGIWLGAVEAPGISLPFRVEFRRNPAGAWEALFAEPDIDDWFSLENVSYVDPRVRFEIPDPSAPSFSGILDEEGNRISGLFSQSGAPAGLTFYLDRTDGVTVRREVFVDDLKLVKGPPGDPNAESVPIQNGDFERPLAEHWTVSSTHADSTITDLSAHGGDNSLHLLSQQGGQDPETAVWQDLPLELGQVYTLSYWYLPTQTPTSLTVELADGSLHSSHIIRPASAVSPGAPYEKSRSLPAIPLIFLNELVVSNPGTDTDGSGEADPWLELYNASTVALDLSTFFLSDDFDHPTRWAFPAETTIGPGEFLLVWLDGQTEQNRPGEIHASLALSDTGGTVLLAARTGGSVWIVDHVNYDAEAAWSVLGRLSEGSRSAWTPLVEPTPRRSNDTASPPVRLRINEWMAANTGALADPADGDFDDWFEIYNDGQAPVDLEGFRLSDSPDFAGSFAIPSGFVVQPKQYLLVWADGEPDQNPPVSPNLHVNFRLSRQGESIALFSPQGSLIDQVLFGAQENNISEGRLPDGAPEPFHRLPQPSPGQPNRPGNPSNLRISAIDVTLEGTLSFRWVSEAGARYRSEFKDDLNELSWTLLQVLEGTGGEISITDRPPPDVGARYYRIVQTD